MQKTKKKQILKMKLKFGSVCGRGIIDLFILITQLKRFFPLHSTSRDTGQVERMLDFLPAHPQLWVATVGYYFLLLKMERTMKHLIFMFLYLSVIMLRGGLPHCMLGYTPLGPDPLPPGPEAGTPGPKAGTPPEQTPPQRTAFWEIRATSGRYASYWNATLLPSIYQRTQKVMLLVVFVSFKVDSFLGTRQEEQPVF